MHHSARSALLGTTLLVLAAASVDAQQDSDACAASFAAVSVDHLGNRGHKTQTVPLKEGQPFRVCIRNTDPSLFLYSLYSVEADQSPKALVIGAPSGPPKLRNVLWPPNDAPPVVHSAAYRGYVLDIRPREGTTVPSQCIPVGQNDPVSCALENLEVIVEVPVARWQVEGDGGFTVSGLTDPRYYLDATLSPPIVLESESTRDKARLGVAAFASLYHRALPAWNILSFGLGVNDSGRTTYYFGTGIRFEGKARLIAGTAIGQIATLPAGAATGKPAPDENVLNNLGRKTDWSWFFGLTYSFAGAGFDDLKKPFAPPPPPKAAK